MVHIVEAGLRRRRQLIASAGRMPALRPADPRAHGGKCNNVAEMSLRYGINPHQAPARVTVEGDMPFKVLNGAPGYINGPFCARDKRQIG